MGTNYCETEGLPSSCAMGGLLESLTRPWTLHILWVLGRNGAMRFGALRRGVEGISSRVLTERLRFLEEKKFISREYKPTIPPEVTYRLTDRMDDFRMVLEHLHAVAVKWEAEDANKSPAPVPSSGVR